jgi:hypothetical protein
MEKILKLIIAVLLFVCLLDMPYGYYQFIRFFACIGFAYLAYKSNEQSNKTVTITFVILAILFQPFVKISLGRELWNIVDVIVGAVLLLSIFVNFNKIIDNKANEK